MFYKYPQYIKQLMNQLKESPEIGYSLESDKFSKAFPSVLEEIKTDKYKTIKSLGTYGQVYCSSPMDYIDNTIITFDENFCNKFNDITMNDCFHIFNVKQISNSFQKTYNDTTFYQINFSMAINKLIPKIASTAYLLFLKLFTKRKMILLCDSTQTDDGMRVWQEILTSEINKVFDISVFDMKNKIEKQLSEFKTFNDIWNYGEEYQNILIDIKNF